MIEISLNRVSFSQANRYIFILQCGDQVKRTEVCQQWTSSPSFPRSLRFNKLDQIIIKACVATNERQLKIIGLFEIHLEQIKQIKDKNILYQQDRQLFQKLQGKFVCIGRCRITITEHQQLNQSTISNQHQQIDDEDDYQLRQQPNNQDAVNNCQMRFIIHCGLNFYLGSSFAVHIKWGINNVSTNFISNKITPIWSDNILLDGVDSQEICLTVIDEKINKLEWLRLYPNNLRLMYPYNLKCVFREECLSKYPQFYITLIRQDIPLYRTIQKKISLYIKPINELIKKQQIYVLIQSSSIKTIKYPKFFEVNLKNRINLDNILQQSLDNNQINYVILVPVAKNRQKKLSDLSILKSMLVKRMDAYLISFYDYKKIFQNEDYTNVEIHDCRQSFEQTLKQIYYYNQKFAMGKLIEISNAGIESEMPTDLQVSPQEQWRILSYNYQLRDKLIRQSNENIQKLKTMISTKGQELSSLKKIRNNLKNMNRVLVQKQQSSLIYKHNQGLKVLENKYHIQDIVKTLYLKQLELENQKNSNNQLRAKLNNLSMYQHNDDQLNQKIIENAHLLHQQQKQIKTMQLLKQSIRKQKIIIERLEKIFQQRVLDRQMNSLLQEKKQQHRDIQRKNRQNLTKIYNTIINESKLNNSIKTKAENAQKQLIRLNQDYAKLKSYQ